MEYASADALLADPAGSFGSALVPATRSLAGASRYNVDGGALEYLNADDILSDAADVATLEGGFDASKVKIGGGGWPSERPGRAEGSGLHLRQSLDIVLIVLFATMAYRSLTERFESSERTFEALTALRRLRRQHEKITYAAMHNRVWDLAPSGAIGVVVRFGGYGARDSSGRHELVVLTASLKEDEVLYSCSLEERCLSDKGCSWRPSMEAALEKVRQVMGVNVQDLFTVLGAAVKTSRLIAGHGVLYGEKTCVVRNGDTSWPFSAVRRTRGGSWVCLSCRTGDGTCDHAGSAVAAAKAEADGAHDSSDSDADEQDGDDETRLLESAGLTAAADQEVADGAAEAPPHLPAATEALLPVNRYKWSSRSAEPRHLVPPRVAQQARAEMMEALRDPTRKLVYHAGAMCPFCRAARTAQTLIVRNTGKVEFEDGVVPATVETWRCHGCLFRVLPDGKARGVIFHSCFTAYSEAFLFKTAVNLARNGSSLHSASYLREAFQELHDGSKHPPASKRLRSVTTLRKALLLYLALVIKGLPYDATSCATCRRPDGSYAIVSFDGLQLGYRVRFKVPFNRTDVKIQAIPRASLVPCMITDQAVSRALGRVLSAKRNVTSMASSKAITTVTAMRGHVMAVTLLLGNVTVDGEEKSFAGDTPHLEGGSSPRGWDPTVDGGASTELVAFMRGFFDLRTAARSLSLTIVSAPDDLRRRVPAALMQRINALVVDSGPPRGASPRLVAVEQDVAEEGQDDAGLHAADSERGSKRARLTRTASSTSSSSTSDDSSGTDVFDSDGDDGFELPRASKKAAEDVWDRQAPLLSYGEALGEPALATTGGAVGADRSQNLSLPLLRHIPSTTASALKVMEFVRAVVVDPTVVWAPQGSWVAVDELLRVLRSPDFTIMSLAAALKTPAVDEQRLLRGAVDCLGPGLDADPSLRGLLAAVLTGLKARVVEYSKWVEEEDASSLDGASTATLREEMAAAHPLHTFTHQQYTDAWLLPPASMETYRCVYDDPTDPSDDYLKTGIWAPGVPVIRPFLGFSGVATANTDLPSCKHEMGKENSHTGGTVGAFCTCAHPKCIGVVVLSGSESQLMPLEFVAQLFVQMPDTIVYDFACATLKSALVRLPYVARRVALKCDRFHWRENHTDCSCAMCPDSYVSLDRVNTSSCEARNALSRRQQHHLRQMKQDQFITFTVYQQALSNAVAMRRDNKTLVVPCKWPEWYRRTYVDGAEARRESA